MCHRNAFFYANGVVPDQTPQSAASDLGLHCLPISLLGILCLNELIQYHSGAVPGVCDRYS